MHHGAVGNVVGAVGDFAGGVISEIQKTGQPNHQPCRGRQCQKADDRTDRIHNHYPVPYDLQTGPLRPNNIHFICGVPHTNARRMTMNLQCGNDIVAFHFDVRFNHIGCRNMIVRNTKQRNGWGPEERFLPGGYFPFQPNKYFEVIILSEPHRFKVAVNNKHLLEFRHRVHLDHVDKLYISGDVTLKQVRFQE